MVAPSPVLIVGDAVSAPTGLGRIAGEIARRADENLKDICRIATLGYGGAGSKRFNFPQYTIESMGGDFVIPNLPDVWEDWAGTEAGIIFFIWDSSRLGWFARPNVMCDIKLLKSFLTTAKIQRWIYSPIDAEGPRGKLAYPLAQCHLGFDRILAYGQWGENMIRQSLGEEASLDRDLGSVPHGIDSKVFYPRDRSICRKGFFQNTEATSVAIGRTQTVLLEDQPLIGTVATNQTRKDWGLWAEVCALFITRHPKARFWVHTDTPERHWSIPQLLVDFGLADRTSISLGYLSDDQMAQAYTACDLTLGIGAGEGFGYPIAESLFCGTPVIHGRYGGAVDFLTEDLLVNPVAFRLEGLYACKRPVFEAKDWVDKMEYLLGKRMNRPGQLDWEIVWPRFEAWFRTGLPNKNIVGTKENFYGPMSSPRMQERV